MDCLRRGLDLVARHLGKAAALGTGARVFLKRGGGKELFWAGESKMIASTLTVSCHSATRASRRACDDRPLWSRSRAITGRRGRAELLARLSANTENAKGVEVANFVGEM